MTSARLGQRVHIRGGGGLPLVYFDTGDSSDTMGTESNVEFDAVDGETFLVHTAAGAPRPTVGGTATCVLHPPTVANGPFMLEVTASGEVSMYADEFSAMAVMPCQVVWFHPSPPT